MVECAQRTNCLSHNYKCKWSARSGFNIGDVRKFATSGYLQSLAKNEIKKCENDFNVRVGAFVTDNTGNVTKMRRELQQDDEVDIIQYGCSAHLLNLLAKDVAV